MQKRVRLPRPRQDLETQTLCGPLLAAKALSFVEHMVSKFGGDPCPVRRGLAAAVKCYVRKTRFILCRQRTGMTHHYRWHCSRVSVR